jgi:hypothetical protein
VDRSEEAELAAFVAERAHAPLRTAYALTGDRVLPRFAQGRQWLTDVRNTRPVAVDDTDLVGRPQRSPSGDRWSTGSASRSPPGRGSPSSTPARTGLSPGSPAG